MYGGAAWDRSAPGDTWQWDGARWTRSTVPGPGGRFHHALAYDANRDRVVLFGGVSEDRKTLGDTWEWDGAAWREVARDGPPPRARHRLAFDGNTETVLLYGGNAPPTEPREGFDLLQDTWSWDGARWSRAIAPGR
jgi:hypothetical protein